MTTKEDKGDEELAKYLASQKLDPSQSIRGMGSEFDFYGGERMRVADGGDVEPVAKKTMPLLDMDGKEKDYRETGGFVDMGRMERADDVPARLSKNEFVFTADAVRNAGEGDIDKGAEVMYNMMKNLEAGGEVSEESQGLEGARRNVSNITKTRRSHIMATETVINRPAPFVEDIGKKLSEQALGLQNVPVVTTGIGGITRQAGETDAGFQARQDAARAFTTRQQNLAGIAPQVAGQDALQQEAQRRAVSGLGSFEPFLQSAQAQAGLASGLGTAALGGIGTAGQELTGAVTALGTSGATLGGVPLGCTSFATRRTTIYVTISITSD